MLNLDLLEEARDQTHIREARYKNKLETFYNSNVKIETFKPRDLVLRNNKASKKLDTIKLGPKWERPYIIREDHMGGSYKLNELKGKKVCCH